jgi:HEXXH motif-containing protein
MHVQPDAMISRWERADVNRILCGVLDGVLSRLGNGTPRVDISRECLSYPGLFAAAYEAQAAWRCGRPAEVECERLAARLHDAVKRARASRARVSASGCPAWSVDLAPPEDHLRDSLARAVSQVPRRPDRLEALAALRIGTWSNADRAAFCEATGVLAAAWPELLDELTEVVQQIALLDGFGVDGFTDVATHGAIYVNRARLGADDAGLPGAIRMAEAIVHEGAHNRCNAAALAEPFLTDPKSGGSEPVVMTPLRRDPRPLTGLLQQLVVLVRSVLLYDRLLDARDPPVAAVARREKLHGQAGEALRAISGHTSKLTDHGRDVVTDARDLLARSAVRATN